jgi:uncharacterized membrane protein (DUF2068 family)
MEAAAIWQALGLIRATATPIYASSLFVRSLDRRSAMNFSHSGLIRVIAFFKLIKAACLIAAGFGVLKLVHTDATAKLEHWVAILGLDPGGRLIGHAIQRITNISPARIRELGVVSFVYAGLFTTEGIGLWRLKRWAEWFTVVITSSLLPVEIYQILHRPTSIKILVLLINIAVVAYLLYRITGERRTPRNEKIA